MTPAKMFDGDLYVLVADAVQMAENAYKNGQADEREACAELCENIDPNDGLLYIQDIASAIRSRGNHGT